MIIGLVFRAVCYQFGALEDLVDTQGANLERCNLHLGPQSIVIISIHPYHCSLRTLTLLQENPEK